MQLINSIKEHIKVFESLENLESDLCLISQYCVESIKGGGKIIFAGNGGSASDAQHLAAELIGRLKDDRIALPSISLATDTSAITCIGNDFGFDYIFSRQIEGIGSTDDIFIPITTSGNSTNLIYATEACIKKDIKVFPFLGKDGGKLKKIVEHSLHVQSMDTARIQEAHIFLGHLLCFAIEEGCLK